MTTEPAELVLRHQAVEMAEERLRRLRRWEAMTPEERHAVECYLPNFGRRCRCLEDR